MKTDFVKSENLVGRFAIVKLWPEIKTAEDECVSRLKLAADALGLECIEILSDGRYLSNPDKKISRNDVDFVIHLHYDTPKNYDAFSFVALWNPVKFYFEWGYSRCSRNLMTHDDFLSCASTAADDQVRRMVRSSSTHLPPLLRLYHSTPDIVHEPTLGNQKLFYAGINWEAVSGGKSRHQEVLKCLDKTGLMRIYGPHIFQGIKVWAGYDSYVKEVPFDGISMVHEIAKSGIALVLSSFAHKESGLMSSRLFESIAAGAVIICDENPFARKNFGDSLLYIDSRTSVEKMVEDIKSHLEWINNNPEKAIEMARRAQAIFRRDFNLLENLKNIYNSFESRKAELKNKICSESENKLCVRVFAIVPEYSNATVESYINSIEIQDYEHIVGTIVVNSNISDLEKTYIKKAVEKAKINVEIIQIDFYEFGIYNNVRALRKFGDIINTLISRYLVEDAFIVLVPTEKMLSNHISVLIGALHNNPEIDCAVTAATLNYEEEQVRSIHEVLDFGHVNRFGPPGYGRFIFRTSGIPVDIDCALPHLHGRPLAVLLGTKKIMQLHPATIDFNLSTEYPLRIWDELAENEIIWAYNPKAFEVLTGFGPRPAPSVQSVVDTAPVSSWTKMRLIKSLFSPKWIRIQLYALKREGLAKRLKVFRKNLKI